MLLHDFDDADKVTCPETKRDCCDPCVRDCSCGSANVVWLPLLFNLPIRFRTENCLDVYVHENSLYSYSTTIKQCF